ncbi:MAG: phosphotransferase [Actinomycetia bacterium]|nr:phosphotransferase [Actinomycetes bacterium]
MDFGAPARPVPAMVADALRSGDVRCQQRAAAVGPSLAGEAERLTWLGAVGVAASEVVLVHREPDGHEWLVTRPPPGSPASAGEHHFDPQGLVLGVARLLRQVHALPVEDCPFVTDADSLVAAARARTESGVVPALGFDEAYRGFEPADLLGRVLAIGPEEGGDPVVIHGAPYLEHLWLDRGQTGGVAGVGSLGVGDRHLDLAIVARSLVAHLGPEAVAAFLEAYDRAAPDDPAQPSLLRLDFFAALSQFLPGPGD